MTQQTASTSVVDRPRVRRGLGLLVGAAICVTPLALAPTASAQTGSGDALGGLGTTLANTIQALPTTLGDPLGGPADQSRRADACTDLAGIGPFLTCLIDRLDGERRARRRGSRRAPARRSAAPRRGSAG